MELVKKSYKIEIQGSKADLLRFITSKEIKRSLYGELLMNPSKNKDCVWIIEKKFKIISKQSDKSLDQKKK